MVEVKLLERRRVTVYAPSMYDVLEDELEVGQRIVVWSTFHSDC